MDSTLLALWFVCGLGSAALGAAIPLSRAHVAWFALAAAGTAAAARPDLLPGLPAVGVLAATGAAVQLVRGVSPTLSAVLAGVLAGIWTAVFEAQGLPAIAAPVAALAVPVAAAVLARREGFAPAAVREETFLFLFVLGAVSAAAPVVFDGWRAALDLNLQDTGAAPVTLPVWTFALSAGAALSGGLYSLWSRR